MSAAQRFQFLCLSSVYTFNIADAIVSILSVFQAKANLRTALKNSAFSRPEKSDGLP